MTGLWLAYIAALPFHRMWTLPWFGTKLQPPELVLVALMLAAGWRWWRGRTRWRLVAADWAAASWGIACAVSVPGLVGVPPAHGAAGVTEALGGLSLVALYASIRLTAEPALLSRFGAWFGTSTALAGVLGVAGVVCAWFGVPTRLATPVQTLVPFLGHTARAQAFTAGPQMLASLLLMAIPLYVGQRLDKGWRRRDTLLVTALAIGLMATFSKTALCVVPALAVMWAVGPDRDGGSSARRKRRAWIAAGVWLVVMAVSVAFSHLMLVRDVEIDRWRNGQVVAGDPIATFEWRGGRWLLMPTTYVYNKKASLLAIADEWPSGIGAGQQPAFATRLQAQGRLPASMWITYPHCTYLGVASELGVMGFVALLLLLTTGAAGIRRLTGPQGLPGWQSAAIAGAASAFLIEAITTDLMNCRHYWWLVAIIAAHTAIRNGLASHDPSASGSRR